MSIGIAGPETGFEVGSYLAQRAEKPDFVMVEIGHGANPVAHKQPFDFTDRRAYIGIEGWLRYPQCSFEKQEEYTGRNNYNIFYIDHDLGVSVEREHEEDRYSWLEGEYDPQTLLPDEAADEVFLNNVISDWHISGTRNAEKLLKEAGRLVTASGLIVLREVITPENSCIRNQSMLDAAGLKIVATSVPGDEDWDRLEKMYIADESMPIGNGSHYLFLSKS